MVLDKEAIFAKGGSPKMHVKMRRQQVTLNMRVKMRHILCRSSWKFYLINGGMVVLWQRS